MSQKSAESLGVAIDGEQEENIAGQTFDGAVVSTKEVGSEASVENTPKSSEEIKPSRNAASEASAVIEQVTETTCSAKDGEGQLINSDETEGTTDITVRFIAFSAEEYQCMVSSGELPVSVQGADVHMQIPGAEAQQVRLIAVDSNGVPVTETAILQAAAEQAGIVFITKDDNNQDIQISIDEVMKLSAGGSGARHNITATTAASLLDQQQSKEPQKDEGNESEDENDGRASKPALQIRAYSRKDLSQASDDSGLPTSMGASSTLVPVNIPEEYNATAMIPAQGMELNDESAHEFQEPPTGKDTEEESNKIAIVDASMFKKGPRRGMDKARDRRKIYQCKECAYYSHRHSKLVCHFRIHTDERPYQCHLCERAFRTHTLLRIHINVHTGVKPYKCAEPDCVMAFVRSRELTRHIRYRHTQEKAFKCTLCDYACVEGSKLRRHFRSHTGERPYNCENCGKAFVDSFHLRSHRLLHTGEKPYECPECNQRFTQRSSVKKHIMQQHLKNAPKFECEICHTLLTCTSSLNVHMRNQHAYKETPIGCRFCEELFHDRWSLMKHQKSHKSYCTRQSQNGRKGKKRA